MAEQNKNIEEYAKDVGRLYKALQAVTKKQNSKDSDRVLAMTDALNSAKNLAFDGLLTTLQEQIKIIQERLKTATERRREDLLRAAKQAGVPHKRYGDYDRIGVFKVTYKGRKIQLEVGSEVLCDLEADDGNQLFKKIQDEERKLEDVGFSRETFFQCLKAALRLARDQGRSQDGRVPVRTLFPYLVATIQTQSDAFIKKPGSRSFQDYSPAQFVYDLARFGRDGWTLGGERLSSQTPNMATIQAGKAMMLPSLNGGEGTGSQLALLWIEKKEV